MVLFLLFFSIRVAPHRVWRREHYASLVVGDLRGLGDVAMDSALDLLNVQLREYAC